MQGLPELITPSLFFSSVLDIIMINNGKILTEKRHEIKPRYLCISDACTFGTDILNTKVNIQTIIFIEKS